MYELSYLKDVGLHSAHVGVEKVRHHTHAVDHFLQIK